MTSLRLDIPTPWHALASAASASRVTDPYVDIS
jgi:hypothetical protein